MGRLHIPVHRLLLYVELVDSLFPVPPQEGQKGWPDTWNGRGPPCQKLSLLYRMGQNRVVLFSRMWELELGFGSLLSDLSLLAWGLKGSEELFPSHRNDQHLQCISWVLLLPSRE